ncbi:MAG TPA: flagellar motor protein MotB [Terriglobales bacterium]|nr:flagellar motor protein MotB [Terriglobales bacterium]
MTRRKKAHGHSSHERWLVSYADFITLLFAFFVVLYASSQVDNRKVAQVARAIQGGFSDLGVFSTPRQGSILRVEESGPAIMAPSPKFPELARLINDMAPAPAPSRSSVPVSVVKRQLEVALQDEIRQNRIEMRVVPDGLVVSLREVGLFDSGEAHLLPGAEPTLAHIGRVLAERGFDFRVEGHTDNMPIHNSSFRSNWELSTARATEVVQVLISKYRFDPAKIAVAGYAEYRPIADNSTEDGRRKNRRIDLVVLASAASVPDPHAPGSQPNRPVQPTQARTQVTPVMYERVR